MAVNCSTGFRARIMGPSAIETIFAGGAIDVYTGSQPPTADMAPTGTLVGRITDSGLPFVDGYPDNGLLFSRNGHRMTKPALQNWTLQGIATGTAGWARLRATSDPGGESQTLPRIDMAIGLIGEAGDYQLRIPTNLLTASTTIPINTWWFVFPPLD